MQSVGEVECNAEGWEIHMEGVTVELPEEAFFSGHESTASVPWSCEHNLWALSMTMSAKRLCATSHMTDTITEELNMMLKLFSDLSGKAYRSGLILLHLTCRFSCLTPFPRLQAIDINILDEGVL